MIGCVDISEVVEWSERTGCMQATMSRKLGNGGTSDTVMNCRNSPKSPRLGEYEREVDNDPGMDSGRLESAMMRSSKPLHLSIIAPSIIVALVVLLSNP